MPGEALLVEGDDHLGTFHIGFLGRDEICLIGVLPVDRRWGGGGEGSGEYWKKGGQEKLNHNQELMNGRVKDQFIVVI